MTSEKKLFSIYIDNLPKVIGMHKRGEPIYDFLFECFKSETKNFFLDDKKDLSPFGEIYFPYHEMGNVNTTNLFDLDELIIFSFYWQSRFKYKNVADLGANVGLHSILLSKCGFNVRAYEPDPVHYQLLTENISKNNCTNVKLYNSAVSNKEGVAEFVRVKGNTMSSHIKGSKPNPYGELEYFNVELQNFNEIIGWADFIKMDVEGHETELILSTSAKDWDKTDAIVEVSNEINAKILFDFLKEDKIRMFSQKECWNEVTQFDHMPVSYKEGSLFISNSNSPFILEQK